MAEHFTFPDEVANALERFADAIGKYLGTEHGGLTEEEAAWDVVKSDYSKEIEAAISRVFDEEERLGGPSELLSRLMPEAVLTGNHATVRSVLKLQGVRSRLLKSGRGYIIRVPERLPEEQEAI